MRVFLGCRGAPAHLTPATSKAADDMVVLKLRIPRAVKDRVDRQLKNGNNGVPRGEISAFFL